MDTRIIIEGLKIRELAKHWLVKSHEIRINESTVSADASVEAL